MNQPHLVLLRAVINILTVYAPIIASLLSVIMLIIITYEEQNFFLLAYHKSHYPEPSRTNKNEPFKERKNPRKEVEEVSLSLSSSRWFSWPSSVSSCSANMWTVRFTVFILGEYFQGIINSIAGAIIIH